MTLTVKEIAAIQKGEPVRTQISEVGTDCVVIRADVFERVQKMLDDEWSEDEMNILAAHTMSELDTAGPIP